MQLAEILRAKWKDEIKKLPPAVRARWLESQEAITALGAANARTISRLLQKQEKLLSQVLCSQDLFIEWLCWGIVPHGLTLIDNRLVRRVDADRKYAVRLVRGRALVRYGNEAGGPGHLPEADVGHRRWTPPQAVAVEDELDLLDPLDALVYDHPSSPSAEAIKRIGWRKGRERLKFEPKDQIVELVQGTGDDRRLKTVSRKAPFVPKG
jgi:hypothetical protein